MFHISLRSTACITPPRYFKANLVVSLTAEEQVKEEIDDESTDDDLYCLLLFKYYDTNFNEP